MIIATLTAIVAAASAIGTLTDFPEKLDPLIHTEAEAAEEHNQIIMAEEQVQQTQAGFNAYALKSIMEQEIEILKLRIEAEDNEEEKGYLKAELKSKMELIRRLEEEARRQLLKGKT